MKGEDRISGLSESKRRESELSMGVSSSPNEEVRRHHNQSAISFDLDV
jgi:hypothetical protein